MKRSLASAGFAFVAVVAVLFGLSSPAQAQALTMTTVSNISAPALSIPTKKGTLPKPRPVIKISPPAKAKVITIRDVKVERKRAAAAVAKAKAKANVVSRSTSRKPVSTSTQAKYTPSGRTGTRGGRNWATPGQCTWGAQIKWHAATGSYLGGFHGNAFTWASRASGAGYSVGSVPRARSVVVFAPGVAGASGVGHVAWVTSVNGDKITIVEMNGSSGPFNWDTRAVRHQRGMQYIYAP